MFLGLLGRGGRDRYKIDINKVKEKGDMVWLWEIGIKEEDCSSGELEGTAVCGYSSKIGCLCLRKKGRKM